MSKHNTQTRLLALMNTIAWEQRTDWIAANAGQAVLLFTEWLQQVIVYIEPKDVRDLVIGYYFDNATGNVGQGYYIKLDQGRAALATLYRYMENVK